MDLKELKEYLGRDWTEVQNCIRTVLKSDISLLNSTNDTILQYSGKQMRPVLSLLVARACVPGRELGSGSWRSAAACELLHNATLLHDDVADESDERRGRPTLYSQMGPAVSVLVGDYWLVKAIECILGTGETSSSEVIMIYARTLSNLAEGEMFQLQKAMSGDTDEDDYLKIIYNKTATLFETAALTAVKAVGGNEKMCSAMADYAKNLGLAFQVRDDIFDYCMDMNVGKPVGADILEKKITMPLLGAFRNVSEEKEQDIRKMVSTIDLHPENRDRIVAFVKENGGLAYAQERLNDMIECALGKLSVLPASEDKELLVKLTRYVGSRII